MELAYDIVRKRSDNVTVSLDTIRKLNIASIASDPECINNKHILKSINDIIDPIIHPTNDISHAILTAYIISSHTIDELDGILDCICLKCDSKLINAANTLVSCIENNKQDQFVDCLDHYYSLYKLLMSNNEVTKIETLYSKLDEQIRIYIIALRKSVSIGIDNIKNIIDEMFVINPKAATKKLLANYKLLSCNPNI